MANPFHIALIEIQNSLDICAQNDNLSEVQRAVGQLDLAVQDTLRGIPQNHPMRETLEITRKSLDEVLGVEEVGLVQETLRQVAKVMGDLAAVAVAA